MEILHSFEKCFRIAFFPIKKQCWPWNMYITVENSLTCVCSYMSLQQPRSRETFSAILTFTSLIMGSDMHGKSGHTDVNLVAMRTTSSLFVSWTSVCLAMSG